MNSKMKYISQKQCVTYIYINCLFRTSNENNFQRKRKINEIKYSKQKETTTENEIYKMERFLVFFLLFPLNLFISQNFKLMI